MEAKTTRSGERGGESRGAGGSGGRERRPCHICNGQTSFLFNMLSF